MEARLARLDATLATVASAPGVSAAAAVYGAPMMDSGSSVDYAIKDRQAFTPGVSNLPHADLREISPTFFATLGVPLLRGRGFTGNDRLSSSKVLLINHALARTMFPHQDPIGQRIVTGFDEGPNDRQGVRTLGRAGE